MKKYILLFSFLIGAEVVSMPTIATILQKYEQALKDLIQDHANVSPTTPINLEPGSAILSTFQKIIVPSIAYVQGYAQVVASEQARLLPYHQDLEKMSKQYFKHQKEVMRIVSLFPQADQAKAIKIFHESVGAACVQTCFNIVQHISYSLSFGSEELVSCFTAYQLAMDIYEDSMTIAGVSANSTLPQMMSDAMISFYNAAIVEFQNNLSTGLSSSSVKSLYKQIDYCYQVLEQVYTDSGHSGHASSMLLQISSTKAQAVSYDQAKTLQQQAQATIKKYRHLPSLDVLTPGSTARRVKQHQKKVLSAYSDFSQAQAAFNAASDSVGAQECATAITTVESIDYAASLLAELWMLYLADQSSSDVLTAPTIASFLSGSSSGATLDDFTQAMQNLIDLLSVPSSSVSTLSSQASQYCVKSLVSTIEQNIISSFGSAAPSDMMVDLSLAQHAKVATGAMLSMCQVILSSCQQTTTNTASNAAALAMTWAKELDALFAKEPKLKTVILYLPGQVTSSANWQDWVAAILVAAKVVPSTAQAMALAGTATITQPTPPGATTDVVATTAKAKKLKAQALASAQAGNFVAATTQYGKAFEAYQSLYQAQVNTSAAPSLYQTAMQMKTLFSASSFAGTIQTTGAQSWKEITGIPVKCFASQYQFTAISMSAFGSSAALPVSLAGLATGSAITTFTPQQTKDVLQIIKAYIVLQLLTQQGINFSNCFVDYSLVFVSGISSVEQQYAKQVLDTVQEAMSDLASTTLLSLALSSDGQTISSVNCGNMPINSCTPLYPQMATAITFLQSSQMLFAPSTTNINLGGTMYAPGNDSKAAALVAEKMVKIYLSDGYKHFKKAKTLMASVAAQVAAGKKLPQNFTENFTKIKSEMLHAQAVLYAKTQSAYVYAQLSGDEGLATAVQDIFFDMYGDMVGWLKLCLVGSPASSDYQMLLREISKTYLNWISMLSPTNNAAQIKSFNLEVAHLFENAGTACMQNSYIDPMFPAYAQKHYTTAAKYFLAAESAYGKFASTALAAQMKSNAQDAYFKSAVQAVELYWHAKKHGLFYEDSAGQMVATSVAELQGQLVFASTGKQHACNAVKNLLLISGMTFEHLDSSKSISGAATTGSASKVMQYLMGKNILTPGIASIPYYQSGMVASIFGVAEAGYAKFKAENPAFLGAWMNTLFFAVEALYAQDYLGASGAVSGQQMVGYDKEFFAALQQEATSMQNPSSAYVG